MHYNLEKIGKTIEFERQKKNITQNKLGEKINVTGKQISNYENGKLVPPIDVLFKLCDIFECELGYLLGEEIYSNGTRASTIITNETGLSIDSINSIIKITGKEKTCLNFGYESEQYRKILNNILTSKKFLDIIKIMFELDNIYIQNEKNNKLQDLRRELGNDLFDKAMNIYLSNNIDENYTQEECAAVAKIDCSIDNARKEDYDFQREMAFMRFKLQEDFTLLLNELYPDKE